MPFIMSYPFLPPSLNSSYKSSPQGMYLDPKVKDFKDLVKLHTQGYDANVIRELDAAQFHEVSYVFTGNFAAFMAGNGWIAKRSKLDFGNEFKALQDAIYSVLQLNDGRIVNGSCKHVHSTSVVRTYVMISPTHMAGVPYG